MKLFKLIQEWILPGSTIISDCWRAYQSLNKDLYDHLT
ncbi:transposase, partial [bacterium LRH843]|nr:transposase [bacterium LRH843]